MKTMTNTISIEEQKEGILREAMDNIYEMDTSADYDFLSGVINDAHRELSRLFEIDAPADQRLEVLRGTLDSIYQDAVAEDFDEVANAIRKAYRQLSRLSDLRRVA